MIMKTIINDGHMVYNVVPVTEKYNNGETKYLIGDRDDYFIEDYFSNDYLYSYLYWVCIINVALLSITLLEDNYILHNSKKKNIVALKYGFYISYIILLILISSIVFY